MAIPVAVTFSELVKRVEALEEAATLPAPAEVNANQLTVIEHPPVSAPDPESESEVTPVHVPVTDPTTSGGPGGASDAELEAERKAQLAAPLVASDIANQTPPEAPSDPSSTVVA